MTTTYRAAYWISADSQSDVRLTTESQQHLSDEQLMEAALSEAESCGLEMSDGRICIGEYRVA